MRAALDGSRYGFCLVLSGRRFLYAESTSLVIAGRDDHTDKEKGGAPGSKRA
jgi:hypothetical protein